jgi:predicted ATPase
MLTNVYVDGFRSLCDFRMEIRPGLNILIGPNGSGKSNIISFFQFLSRLMRTGLTDAVSLTGGAGAFFQKVGGATSFKNEVKVEVSGLTVARDRELSPDPVWLRYEYTFTVQASERFDSIVFAKQKVSLKSTLGQEGSEPQIDMKVPERDWDLVIQSSAEPPAVEVTTLSENNWLTPALRSAARPGRRKISKAEIDEYLKRDLGTDGAQATALVRAPFYGLYAMHYIANDLFGGETLNINPGKVKEPEDSAREPGIRSDGSGLAATLWHMRNEPTYRGPYGNRPSSSFRRQRWPVEVYNQLQSLMQLVNTQIQSIEVAPEPFDNLLKIKLRMIGQRGVVVDLPLAAMSDGTIKWASLITAVLTSRAIFAIEEPENFLHPLMLIEILKLMRTVTEMQSSFVIMTTHSETLLNATNPHEVIVVSMDEGVTRARRPRNPEHLAQEIRETGFGLGHYYLAGDLSDA